MFGPTILSVAAFRSQPQSKAEFVIKSHSGCDTVREFGRRVRFPVGSIPALLVIPKRGAVIGG
jgi:hypothetical protein